TRLAQLSEHDGWTDPARAFGERHLAEQRADQRRLAGAVRTDDRKPVAAVQLERDGPEPERAAVDHRSGELDNQPGRRSWSRLELQPPGRPRLLHLVQPLEEVLRLPHLAAQRIRGASPGLLRAERSRFSPPGPEERGVPRPLTRVLGEVPCVLRPGTLARRLV